MASGALRPFGMLRAWSSLGALPRHPRTMLIYDASLTWAAILLLAIGLVMVGSRATSAKRANRVRGRAGRVEAAAMERHVRVGIGDEI